VAALEGTPIGPEHVAAVVPDASTGTVVDLQRRRVLRAASPQVRLDTDLATPIDLGRRPGSDPRPLPRSFRHVGTSGSSQRSGDRR
jgi:hypothetical protein